MADAGGEGVRRFAAVAAALSRQPGIKFGQGSSRLFGRSALIVHGTTIAVLSSDGRLVVKLPAGRVDAFVASVAGQRFGNGQGRPLKDWLEVNSESVQDWLELTLEALKFAGI